MNDEECRYVGNSLSTSCRGSVDAFARSLQKRFNSLSIENHDEEIEKPTNWYQNGHGRQVDQFMTSPRSPENEIPNPLSNGITGHFINPELFLDTRPIEFAGCDRSSALNSESSDNRVSDIFSEEGKRVTSSENYIDSSSVDDNYETASDLSADENDVEVFVTEVEIVETEVPSLSAADSSSSKGINVQEDASESTENIAPPKIRRCSSLKTGKTPPGTPGGKKIVRFADALGLDLADIKTYVDEIPKVPTSAYNDLNNLDDDAEDLIMMKPCRGNQAKSALIPLFTQPGEKFDFIERIRRCNVCLESAMLDDPICCSIKGVVRVRNIDFHKTVFVRYSRDRWRTSLDAPANYVDNSCDGFSDKFTFLIFANMLTLGDKLEFAVCFRAKGNEYWDNNNGANYVFECISLQTVSLAPLVSPPSWSHDHWGGAAFY